jgi:hypothetical protein
VSAVPRICQSIPSALLAILLATSAGLAAAAPSPMWPCLPPIFDHGERLHALPGPSVFRLDFLLRQHEICRRWIPGEVRIVLAGSSSVYGFPLTTEHTFAHMLNDHFAAAAIPAHVFNLAFVNPYQVRDAVIIDAARSFAPDIIVYPITLAEFSHYAPVFFSTMVKFFGANRTAVLQLAEHPPSGLDEPIRKYATVLNRPNARTSTWNYLQEAGGLLRSALRIHARAVAERLGSVPTSLVNESLQRQTSYDCAKTHALVAQHYRNWQTWNILSYLEELQRSEGIDVVVVAWPLAHEPVDDCYSVRYTEESVEQFDSWVQEESARRGLSFVDLHALLSPELFLDSLHVSAEGHARVAAALESVLDPLIASRLERCRRGGSGCSAMTDAQN